MSVNKNWEDWKVIWRDNKSYLYRLQKLSPEQPQKKLLQKKKYPEQSSVILKTKKGKMKKNSFNYNESNSSDSYEDVIDSDSGQKVTIAKTDKTKIYWQMVDWSQERRGFKFLNIKKQFKAFQMARSADISPARLQERWLEFEKDKFWKEKGFDWLDVYNSFNKKA